MPRAARSTSKKAKSSGRPKSPTKGKPSAPGGLAELRKERKDSLQISTAEPGFKHPSGTIRVDLANAKKAFDLNDDDLASLPYETVMQPHAAQLYNHDQLLDLAQRKSTKLGMDFQVPEVTVYSSLIDSIQGPSGLAPSQKNAPLPNPQPLTIAAYTSPSNAVKPDPEKIFWSPSYIPGPVTVEDACRLYCITPGDIQDLAKHSPLIDLPTVAKRAVTLHGGFFAHKELVHQRRQEEEAAMTREFSDREAEKRESHFRYSSMVARQMKDLARDLVNDPYYLSAVTHDLTSHRVAVLYPIKYRCDDDRGYDWNYEPFWGDF